MSTPSVPAQEDLSLEQRVAMLPPAEQDEILAGLDLEELAYSWEWMARKKQWLDPEDTSWAIAAMLGGRGTGKALALDTPIPTPGGWTQNGDLQVGDSVFDEAGRICHVLAVHDIKPEKAYRVEFSDGTSMTACGDHRWVTWDQHERTQYSRRFRERHPGVPVRFPENWPTYRQDVYDGWGNTIGQLGPQIRTTAEIAQTQTARRCRNNHCIPLAEPLRLPPINIMGFTPWLAGYALARGDWSKVTHDQLMASIKIRKQPEKVLNYVFRRYLRSAVQQRVELLRGIMDARGYTSCKASVVRASFPWSGEVTRMFLELVRSLGERPTLEKDGRVCWRPTRFIPYTPTKRKGKKISAPGTQGMRVQHRMITVVTEAPTPEVMRCLTVDSHNSMYLAGEAMIPTHNTRLATEWVRLMDERWASMPERHGMTGDGTLRVAFLSRTVADVRDTLITGPSGILNIYPPSLRDQVDWNPSLRRVTLPHGGIVTTFSAESPDQVRGPEFHIAIADELAAHKGKTGADGLTGWDNLRIACRMGTRPQIVATTTPKRTPQMRKLVAESKIPDNKIMLRKMRTRDNPYLSEGYLAVLEGLYAGTSIGAQELEGEMLEDVVGALLKPATIDRSRATELPDGFWGDGYQRILGVDPSVSSGQGDICGITLIGGKPVLPVYKREAFVVEDLSLQAAPEEWSRVVAQAAHDYHATVVVEANQGGSMASLVIRTAAQELGLPVPQIKEVWASGSKKTRAEPIAVAYERGRIHHLNVLPELESQWTEWVEGESGYSPDHLDSCVWACASFLQPSAVKGSHGGRAAVYSPNQLMGRIPARSAVAGAGRGRTFNTGIPRR